MITIINFLADAALKLIPVSDSPRLDAEVLLSLATGKSRAYFRAWPEKPVSQAEGAAFQCLLEKRLAGHPIAHLTGTREFWSREFMVTPDVLIPRPETELLVELALHLVADLGSKATFKCPHPDPLPTGDRVLSRFAALATPEPCVIQIADLGTGSGAVAITLGLELPQAAITALDLSPAALIIAAENATRLGAGNVRLIHSDWLAELPAQERFYLIVSNPPYIAENDPHLHLGDVRFEPNLALSSGPDGLDAIRRIVNDAPNPLQPGGWLLFEHGYDQADKSRELLQAAGFEDIASFPDLQGHVRVSAGRIGKMPHSLYVQQPIESKPCPTHP